MQNFVSSICSGIVKSYINSGNKYNPETFSADFVEKTIETIDVFNINGISKCGSISGEECAKNVLQAIEPFDPIGVVGVISSFLNVECPSQFSRIDFGYKDYMKLMDPFEEKPLP